MDDDIRFCGATGGFCLESEIRAARLFKDTAKDEVGRVVEARMLEKNGSVTSVVSSRVVFLFRLETWFFHGVGKADF
jgi:hypothetical protein